MKPRPKKAFIWEKSVKEFPARQRAARFSIDQAMEKMKQNLGGN